MPSGAKKRKAAKKKKQQQAYPSGNNSQGNGDKKVEDERDSDTTSELNSPASEGNPHHQHTFSEGNGGESEKSGQSPDESVVSKNKLEGKEGIGEAGRSEEAGQQQDVEVKIEEDVKSLEVSIEHVDSEKVSNGDSSSTSSSSDDESSAVDNKGGEHLQNTAVLTPAEEVIPIPEMNAVIATSEEVVMPNEVSNDMGKNDAAPLDSDTPSVPMSEVMERQLEATQVVDSEVIDIVERGLKENEVKLSLPKSYPSNEVPVPLDSGKNEEVMPTTSHQSAEMGVSYVTVKSLTTSGAVETTVNQNPPGTETSAKDTNFSYSIEKQPLIASAPRVSQRTSFLNCCGLFDAFTSSDR